MMLLRGIKLPNLAAVQCLHDADPREHRRAAEVGHQHQSFDGGLPFRRGGFLLWKRSDVARRVAKNDQLSPVRQLEGSSNSRPQSDEGSDISPPGDYPTRGDGPRQGVR